MIYALIDASNLDYHLHAALFWYWIWKAIYQKPGDEHGHSEIPPPPPSNNANQHADANLLIQHA